jgi:hypothetical protein
MKTVGRNLQIDFRWTTSDADRIRKYAAEADYSGLMFATRITLP